MSDPAVCSFITKVLCSSGGRLEFSQIPQHVGLPEPQLEQILRDVGHERFLVHMQGGCRWVLAVSPLRLCVRKECAGCQCLHFCKLNLMGKCNFGTRDRHMACKYSHDIFSDGNRKVLKSHEVSGLNENELRVLLLQNDPFLLPDVCQFYNKGEGLYGSCSQQGSCNKLHVCRHFLRGECRFPTCKRSHKILDSNVLMLLLAEGLNRSVAENIQIICDHKHAEFSKVVGQRRMPHYRATQDHAEGSTCTQYALVSLHAHNRSLASNCTPSPVKNLFSAMPHTNIHIPFWESLLGSHATVSWPKTRTKSCHNGDTIQRKSQRLNRQTPSLNGICLGKLAGGYARLLGCPGPAATVLLPLPGCKGSGPTFTSLAMRRALSCWPSCPGALSLRNIHDPAGLASQGQCKCWLKEGTQLHSASVRRIFPHSCSGCLMDMEVLPVLYAGTHMDLPLLSPLREHDGPKLREQQNCTHSTWVSLVKSVCLTLCIKAVPSTKVSVRKDIEKRDEICLYYIWRHCIHKDNCRMIHYSLPYRWQTFNGVNWIDLPRMEVVEKAYCDPQNDRISVSSVADQNINFKSLSSTSTLFRRLSTPSSVTKPSKFILTTKWIWYWKNDLGKWIEYGKQDGLRDASALTSDDLENLFLAAPNDTVQFQAGSQNYEISFKEMVQKNIHYQTQREVRRRPKFVSSEDVKKMKKGYSTMHSYPPSVPFFLGLSIGQGLLLAFSKQSKTVEITKTSSEYTDIESLFKKTMNNFAIQRIRRIQNPSLWQVFQWQKEQMKKKNGGKDVDERLLFHGTNSSYLEAICNHNFDWRICGVHGTKYGKGSYFATDAKYSHSYSQSAAKGNTVFVARVLVGDFVRGDPSYVRPPQKPDSCVDSTMVPSIFVIFEKHQIYPEYMIDYSEEEKKCFVS
uniref:Poly(ADP-ribose) polymerase family member 12 n=1 Tax=Pelodiscus sinensis TaxID=13735 RepID=K7FWN3_PELSI